MLVISAVFVVALGVILRGVRVRLHDGGGREAGVCVRRTVGRGEAGETSGARFRKTASGRLSSAREFENAGR